MASPPPERARGELSTVDVRDRTDDRESQAASLGLRRRRGRRREWTRPRCDRESPCAWARRRGCPSPRRSPSTLEKGSVLSPIGSARLWRRRWPWRGAGSSRSWWLQQRGRRPYGLCRVLRQRAHLAALDVLAPGDAALHAANDARLSDAPRRARLL